MPTAAPISRINDFVVRFANVNGSGSASANEMFARAILRMGVPVAPLGTAQMLLKVPYCERRDGLLDLDLFPRRHQAQEAQYPEKPL